MNVALTLPRQAHKKEVEAGLVGDLPILWPAASLSSKDKFCGLSFSLFTSYLYLNLKFLLACNVNQEIVFFCVAVSAIHPNFVYS